MSGILMSHLAVITKDKGGIGQRRGAPVAETSNCQGASFERVWKLPPPHQPDKRGHQTCGGLVLLWLVGSLRCSQNQPKAPKISRNLTPFKSFVAVSFSTTMYLATSSQCSMFFSASISASAFPPPAALFVEGGG